MAVQVAREQAGQLVEHGLRAVALGAQDEPLAVPGAEAHDLQDAGGVDRLGCVGTVAAEGDGAEDVLDELAGLLSRDLDSHE